MSKVSLYIGNLPYTANEEHVVAHFAAFNPDNVRIIENKGFAFVDVEAELGASAIEQMDGSEMMGRRLRVSEARPREPRPREGGPGFRGPQAPPMESFRGERGWDSDRGGFDRGDGRKAGKPGRGARRGDGREPRW